MPTPPAARAGIAAALFAYTTWGLFPVYFRQLAAIEPVEILAWRIVLAFALLAGVMLVVPGPRDLWRRLREVRQWWLVLAATVMITINWLTFIIAIDRGEILQGSLGYFLVPLVNTALGRFMFGERTSTVRQWAVGVAAVGMSLTFVIASVLPLLSLIIAFTFGLYGAIRKRADVDSVTGLLLETALLAPAAALWLWWYGQNVMLLPDITRHWLALSGLLTVLPLLAMVFAARQLTLGTLGITQYITPTMQFVVAVGLYGEAIDPARAMAFATTVLAVGIWFLG